MKRKFDDSVNKGQQIRDLVVECYNSLPKKGKPAQHEFTVLAGIVVELDKQLQVVSIGTGNKCLPCDSQQKQMGRTINDSHAEVICKRSFQRFLLHQMMLSISETAASNSTSYQQQRNKCYSSIFTLQAGEKESKKFVLKKDVIFHMYVSTTPCGDASIIQGQSGEIKSTGAKRVKVDEDTGDVCLPQAKDVDCGEAQEAGILRRKPGKGAATDQMSCSDKLLKWNIMGIQGKRLYSFLNEPIYISSITIGASYDDNQDNVYHSVKRALLQRGQDDETLISIFLDNSSKFKQNFVLNPLDIFIVKANNVSLGLDGTSPSGTALNWYCTQTIKRCIQTQSQQLSQTNKKDKVERQQQDTSCSLQHSGGELEYQIRGSNLSKSFKIQNNGINDVEVTISGSGYKMGSSKKSKALQSPKCWSRLCRISMERDIEKLQEQVFGSDNLVGSKLYQQLWLQIKKESKLFSTWLHKQSVVQEQDQP